MQLATDRVNVDTFSSSYQQQVGWLWSVRPTLPAVSATSDRRPRVCNFKIHIDSAAPKRRFLSFSLLVTRLRFAAPTYVQGSIQFVPVKHLSNQVHSHPPQGFYIENQQNKIFFWTSLIFTDYYLDDGENKEGKSEINSPFHLSNFNRKENYFDIQISLDGTAKKSVSTYYVIINFSLLSIK